ncbi:MAG: hypothetical protein ACFB3T_15865 [Geminicoccaceae bacterium]
MSLALFGCAGVDPGEIAVNTAANTLRAACEAGRSCDNVCPDGTVANGPGYTCPSVASPSQGRDLWRNGQP